jgi:hypothetical protein
MNAVRYGLALILVVTLPVLLLSWMLIHPSPLPQRGEGRVRGNERIIACSFPQSSIAARNMNEATMSP